MAGPELFTSCIASSQTFDRGELVEINAHSLFSKWFSESGKLVMQLFKSLDELCEDPTVRHRDARHERTQSRPIASLASLRSAIIADPRLHFLRIADAHHTRTAPTGNTNPKENKTGPVNLRLQSD